jgi:predicted N-acetyltransferase YhbS
MEQRERAESWCSMSTPISHFPIPISDLFDLLEETFPGVDAARAAAERFGAPWESVSTPFVREERGRILSHVGLLSLPLVVGGRPMVVGGVHAVATRAALRRQGLYRSVMERLLSYADARYQTMILTTVHPEYFEPFGFRIVPESVFLIDVEPRRRSSTARKLDLAHEPDRRLMHRLLESRAPVSERLGIGADKAVWAFYEAGSELRYSRELDLVVIAERAGRALRLYDLVGPVVPPLGAVLDAIQEPVDRVVAFFAPDRLGATWEAVPHDLEGGETSLEPGIRNTVLMVRGPFAVSGRPLMLPRPGRC